MRKRAGQLGRCNRAIEERRDEARAARLAERAGPRMERGPVAQPLEISGPAFEPGGEAIESGSRQRLRPERAPQMKVEMPEKLAERRIALGWLGRKIGPLQLDRVDVGTRAEARHAHIGTPLVAPPATAGEKES